MTREDYVSFETAKLLKEKGFDARCPMIYTADGKMLYTDVKHHNMYAVTNKQLEYYTDIIAPTLSMAMKWLRERGWFIHIDIIREASAWQVDVQDIKNDVAIYPVGKECSSYEEACEVAIKYCLENLI